MKEIVIKQSAIEKCSTETILKRVKRLAESTRTTIENLNVNISGNSIVVS
jgi:hypothetical protein